MYFCPKGCEHKAPGPAFEVEEIHTYIAYLNPDGEVTGQAPAGLDRTGKVRCWTCHALAEWRDARQEELFAVEPAMFG